jgi:hypothetical protein
MNAVHTPEVTPAIAMDEVTSNNIFAIGYDAHTGILAVRFRSFAKAPEETKPTSLYHYEHVDPVTHARVVAGDIGASVTKTFNELVKSHPTRYPYTKKESAPGVPVVQIGATDVS